MDEATAEIYQAVISSPDFQENILEEEPVLEAIGFFKGMKRLTKKEYRSAKIGIRVIEEVIYKNLATSPAWGAEKGRTYRTERI